MFELKPLSQSGIDAALEKAERYRLLNEPKEAESICLDVLMVQEANQRALITLILALSDQFETSGNTPARQARGLIERLDDAYAREYYSGIIAERQAKAALASSSPGRHHDAYEWFREAMDFFEKAETLRPEGNDSAILRWNTCVRIIEERRLRARPKDTFNPMLE